MKDDKYKVEIVDTLCDWVKYVDDYIKANPEYEYVESSLITSIDHFSSFTNNDTTLSTPSLIRRIIFRKKDKYNDNY